MKLSHAEAQALVSARIDGPLDPVAERELNAHLAACGSCRAFYASTSQLARGLQTLPFLPVSPAVTRAVLDHVSTPRSPLSWLTGSLPANALPAASAIAVAVIVVFAGSFAAFRFLDAGDEPSTIPASTLSVTDLTQSVAETAEATLAEADTSIAAPADSMEAQIFATEESARATEDTAVDPGTEAAAGDDVDAIGPPPSTSTEGETARLPRLTEEPPAAPTDVPVPTEEPTETVRPTPGPSLRSLLGLETQAPPDDAATEPATVPTAEPTAEPEPTEEPAEIPTATLAPEPTDVPEPTEPTTNLAILGPSGGTTVEATSEPATAVPPTPTPEPTPAPTEEPTPEPTATPEPTPQPTATIEPSPTPEPTDVPEPTIEPTPTVIPIQQRGEGPPDDDDGVESEPAGPDPESSEEGDQGDDAFGGGEDSSGDDGVASPADDAGIQQVVPGDDNQGDDSSGDDIGDFFGDDDDASLIEPVEPGDDEDEQTILPSGGLADDPDTAEGSDESPDEGDPDSSQSTLAGGSTSLGEAAFFEPITNIPGDPAGRLGVSADGNLIFSAGPGRASLERDGIALTTGDGPTGQVIAACDGNNPCVDISSQSSGGGTVDSPLGWLNGEVIYERLGGDQFPVEFRAIAIDQGSLQPVNDRSIGGGEFELETLTRPYPVDGGLLVPTRAGWLRLTPSSVEVIGDYATGQDVGLIRVDQSSGQISYVSGRNLILASTSSPGSPIVQIPFSGSDYAFSPDGSRIAVTTGSGIEIWDSAGIAQTTYPNDGVALGGLIWIGQGLVFVDLSNGALRIIQP